MRAAAPPLAVQRALRRAASSRGAPPPAAIALDYAATVVPRSGGVEDGAWRRADDALVSAAASDAGPASGVALLGLSLSACEALAASHAQPAFRGRQLHAGLYGRRPARSLADIPGLPPSWRASLASAGAWVGRSDVHQTAASSDGTVKLLLRLSDGRVVETVGIPTPAEGATKRRLTVCVSSQVGCPMRCSFCATGKGGFARNLAPHEVVDQVLSIQELFNERATNVVFMGMGEPLLNLRNVLASLRCLNEDVGIAARGITVSTVGVPNALARLAEHSLQSTLAVSLHAPNQAIRERIVPSAKAYPLSALLSDCAAYQASTGRRISFEYALMAGVNDSPHHAEELAGLLRGYNLAGHVNLIPYNPNPGGAAFERPSNNAIRRFTEALKAAGCGASVRQTRGSDAAAACGQLRNEWQAKASALAAVPGASA